MTTYYWWIRPNSQAPFHLFEGELGRSLCGLATAIGSARVKPYVADRKPPRDHCKHCLKFGRVYTGNVNRKEKRK